MMSTSYSKPSYKIELGGIVRDSLVFISVTIFDTPNVNKIQKFASAIPKHNDNLINCLKAIGYNKNLKLSKYAFWRSLVSASYLTLER